jgi:polyhydroxyalkanoate synthase subunit PhaC
MPAIGPAELVERVRRDARRNALRARNGVKVAAGIDRPKLGQTPKDLVWERDRCQLWRYRNDDVRLSPPLLIVFSLVSRPYVFDLRPGNSFVEHLLGAGFDVFLLDWGVPDARDADNRLEDYADGYLPEVLDRTCEVAGTDDVNLLGYCFGGVLSLLCAAHHPDAPLRSLTVMATPVDFSDSGVWSSVIGGGRVDLDAVLDEDGNVPPDVVQNAFRLLRPTGELRQYADLLQHVWNDEFVAAYQAMTQWSNDHIPFPGATARQTAEMLVGENAFMTDRLRLGGDPVHLRDITVPFLAVLASRDYIVPEHVAAPVTDLVGSEDAQMVTLDGGHVGLAVGRSAANVTIPRIIDFLRTRSEELS